MTENTDPRGGEYEDSEIPGESPAEHSARPGEFTGSEIPGETTPVQPDEQGEFTDSDIPGEHKGPHDGHEHGSYTDTDRG